MEDLLVDTHQVLLPALEQSIMAVVLINERDRILFFNPAAEHLWGHAAADVLGRDIECLVPHGLREFHGDYVLRNRLGGENKVVGRSREVLLERKDGSTCWVAFTLSKVDVGGKIHYMGLLRDISREVAQREENRLLLLAINHTDRVVFVLDQTLRIVQINQAFTELFGYPAAEAIGRSPSDFLISSDVDAATVTDWRCKAQQGEGFQAEVKCIDKSRRTIWVRASIQPVLDEADAGAPRNFVVALADITEERQIRDLQRDVLEALVSGLALVDVGELLCRRVEVMAPEVVSSILLVDAERRLRPWAGPQLSEQYSQGVDGVAIGEGVGSCGTAAFRGSPVLVDDLGNDPSAAAFRHLVVPLGLKACWSYPIKRRDGQVAGTFAFYFRERRGPSALHWRIVEACVHLCMLAIDREESRRQIARLAQFDGLTGLPNRSHLNRHAKALLEHASGRHLGFFCLDLDRFKDINETLGYQAGDQVLVEVANRLQAQLGPTDCIGRLEGDAFMLLVEGCDVQKAQLFAMHLQQVLGEPIEVAGLSLHLDTSIGISLYPEGGSDQETLFKSAKRAMSGIKSAGGGGYLFFSPEMNQIAQDRLLLGGALKRAIVEGRLTLHYQPQVRTGSAELYGVEALARWVDAQFGEVPPGKFIALAEELGEMQAFSQWALREACRQMAVWREQGIRVPAVSVNVSPSNLCDGDLPGFVAALLEEYRLPGECLTIEITEGLMMDMTPATLQVLQGIRDLGAGLSVDDFGTGFSSLSSLADLPVTEMKIDRSFIDRCVAEPRALALVQAVIGIGRSLELSVVAEGVENAEQHALLEPHACLVVQGYLHARPMPAGELARWLER